MCLSYGTELGWISPMQPMLTSESPPIGTNPMTLETIAWLGSISHLGSVVGTLLWCVIADCFGRKLATAVIAVPYTVSWTLILIADRVEWLYAARFISGFASCGSRSIVPAFISEIADDDIRGFFGSFPILFLDLGVLFSYTFVAYFKYYGTAIIGLAIPVVFLLTFVWMPESPVFLWKRGKADEAKRSLLWYRGGDKATVEKTLLTYKLFPIIQNKSLNALISTKGTRKALIIALSLAVALQTSGYFIIVSYAVSIFETSKTSLSPHDSAIFIISVQFAFSCITSLTVDRLGRKILLVASEAVMTLTLLCLGYHFFVLNSQSEDTVFQWAPVVLLSIHLAAHGLKAPVAFTLKAEVFPPEVKGLALSLMTLANSILSFTSIKMFPTARAMLKLHGCFWILSGCSFFFAIFFTIYIPETKRKPQSVILLQLNGQDLNGQVSTEEWNRNSGKSYTGLRNLEQSPMV